jgi:choline dehydrogenase
MPSITNAQIYAPVMMIAEKAADLILGNTPLTPEHPGGRPASAPVLGAGPVPEPEADSPGQKAGSGSQARPKHSSAPPVPRAAQDPTPAAVHPG